MRSDPRLSRAARHVRSSRPMTKARGSFRAYLWSTFTRYTIDSRPGEADRQHGITLRLGRYPFPPLVPRVRREFSRAREAYGRALIRRSPSRVKGNSARECHAMSLTAASTSHRPGLRAPFGHQASHHDPWPVLSVSRALYGSASSQKGASTKIPRRTRGPGRGNRPLPCARLAGAMKVDQATTPSAMTMTWCPSRGT